MSIPSNGITAEVIRSVMPPYHLSTDLLAGAFRALPAPPADATTAWRHARIARLVQEIGGLMPADAPQARIAAEIVIVREAADDTFARSHAPGLTVEQLCRLRRTAADLARSAATLERGLARRQAMPAPFFGTVEADAVDIGALDAVWCRGAAAAAGAGGRAAGCRAGACRRARRSWPGDQPGGAADRWRGGARPCSAAGAGRGRRGETGARPAEPRGGSRLMPRGPGRRRRQRTRRCGRGARCRGGGAAWAGCRREPRRGRRRGWTRGRAGRSTSCGRGSDGDAAVRRGAHRVVARWQAGEAVQRGERRRATGAGPGSGACRGRCPPGRGGKRRFRDSTHEQWRRWRNGGGTCRGACRGRCPQGRGGKRRFRNSTHEQWRRWRNGGGTCRGACRGRCRQGRGGKRRFRDSTHEQ